MQELDKNRIPAHVALICDGNGRWAKKRGMPRTYGHRKGGFVIRDTVQNAAKLGIKAVTFFCFSTENWNRPEDEVKYLMTAPAKFLKRYMKDLASTNARIRMLGRRDRLPKIFMDVINEVEEKTKDHTGIICNLCIDYGSYDEITTAVKKIASEYKDGNITLDDITPALIEGNLFTKDLPKLDLLIRTSGECRISNFLLWQLGYAELYFTDTLWPDFDNNELIKAIADYQKRDRRFGGIKNENK
ncbi:MAG: isoprenyl transferase [Acholeplasmatales bacterium]|nr:isoprenyl transferase [Acholeplasmatales bacterium]